MRNTIQEPSRRLKVAAEYDTVVVGGGIAGVAAAVAAARNGASVCLLEKEHGLGGLATLGNVTIWLPICDGRGRQVIGGLGEELLRLSVREVTKNNPSTRFTGVPPCWEPGGDLEQRKISRFRVSFNPFSYLLALEELTLESGVDIFYDSRMCSVTRDERQKLISHVIIENKSGRLAIAGRNFIDASGDADLCALAGEKTESLDANVPCGWFYYLVDGKPYLKPCSNSYSANLTREGSEGPFFRGEEVSDMLLASRQLIRHEIERLRQLHPESEIQVFGLPSIPCFRATRRLAGQFSLGREHEHQSFDDVIGMTGDWRRAGPIYSMPWRCLKGCENRNLAAAGRCISVQNNLWDCARAIPACVMTGQAAGTASAAALASAGGVVANLNIKHLQKRLREDGAVLSL